METGTIVAICVIVGFFVVIVGVAIVLGCLSQPSRGRAATAENAAAMGGATETIFYVTLVAPTLVLTLDVAQTRSAMQKEHPLVKVADIGPLVAQAVGLELIARHGRDSLLAYYDGVAHAFVEVDLLKLVLDPSAMAVTSQVPLCVVHGDDNLKPGVAGGLNGATAALFASTDVFTGVRALHTSAHHPDVDKDDRSVPLSSARRRSKDHVAVSVPLSGSVAAVASVGRDILDPPGKRLPLVTPRLYPRDPVIVNSRQLYVVANRYVDLRSQQLATLDSDVVQAIDELWLKHTQGGKRRFPNEARRATIAKATVRLHGDDSGAIGHLPAHHGLNIVEVAVAGKQDELLVVAVVPARVKTCWSTDGHWEEYEPFVLPPGRWCVRAECVNQPGEHHLEHKSASRVFTVQHEHV